MELRRSSLRTLGGPTRLTAALALLTLLLAALPARSQDDRNQNAGRRTVRGDGRGLATFGDRGLTTFGDRGLTTFGDRGLESFSDIPLAPMGGLVPSTEGARDSGGRRSGTRTTRWRHRVGDHYEGVLPASSSHASVTSLNGISLGSGFVAGFLLPAVDLPTLTLDHRPAATALDELVQAESSRAHAAGDVELARTLALRAGR